MNDFHQLKNDLVTITTEGIDAAHFFVTIPCWHFVWEA